MTLDITLTLLNAILTVILAGIGIEMVNSPPDKDWKKWVYRCVFIVVGLAVVAVTAIQSIHSGSEQELLRIASAQMERTLSNQVSEQSGKLDAISHFEQQFLTFVSQSPRSSEPDAMEKAYEAMALSVLKMSQPSPASSSDEPNLSVFYGNAPLNGRTIGAIDGGATPPSVQLGDLHLYNGGGRDTGPVSVRLYLSRGLGSLSTPFWQATQSDDPAFPYAYYSNGVGPIVINPKETWNWPAFQGQLSAAGNDPINAKLKVYYGASKPAEAQFTIAKKD